MKKEIINGHKINEEVSMPDGGRVVLFYDEQKLGELRFDNHNIFRLNKEGKVIWQVQRNEQGKVNWEAAHEIERAKSKEGERRPFTSMYLLTAQDEDVKTNAWFPGLRLRALAKGIYEIDVETGVATNVTPVPWRDW